MKRILYILSILLIWGCATTKKGSDVQTLNNRVGQPIIELEPICYSNATDTLTGWFDGFNSFVYDLNNDYVGELGVDVQGVQTKYCEPQRQYFKDCFLPDQYANVWGWAGNGHLTRYDPLTGDTEFLCDLPVGGFALAFKNDVTEPTLFFQVGGNLYKADPADPCGTFALVGSTAPATSNYPCFDFDPSGRLLLGNGNQVWIVDPDTGASSTPISLTDARDGANLNVSPGDWHFDPNGQWFMMARDNRGASFTDPNGDPYCTGTALWKIDPTSYVATRVNNSCSPVSGTGSTWLAAGKHLLSTSGGLTYVHNVYTETWDVQYNADDSGTNTAINDLASQWIIPDALLLCGWKNLDCDDPSSCNPTLYEIRANEETGIQECVPYKSELTGKWGVCEKENNPFVSDPSQADDEFLSDQDWHEGCSDAGFTYWRVSYDPAFNPVYEYVYGTLGLDESVTIPPTNFNPIPCGEVLPGTENVTTFCNLDNNKTVYRRQETLTDGTVEITWFDASNPNITPAPTNVTAGSCQETDPLLPITSTEICFEEDNYIREKREIYLTNADGLPELQSTQIIYFNEDGILWDSGVVNSGDPFPTGEPTGWYLGDCIFPYDEIVNEKLCEFDSEKILLIDSGGEFAEYDLNTGTYEVISTLSVPSAGSGADPDNFLLYAITQSGDLQVVDVNTKTTLSTNAFIYK